MFIALYGCGTGADSKTTNPVTGYSMTLTADLASLAAGNSTVVTATVTDGAGLPANGQLVTFTLPINNSAATIVTISETTGANGKAVAVYTAGAANPGVDVNDTIRAAVSSVAGAVIVTRTKATIAPAGVYRLTLTADVTSLAAGQNSIITATVTDGTGNLVSGQTVTFSFISNLSGAATPINISGTTDASGKALAVYTAGALLPTTSVQDAIRASVTGSSGAVIITRTASTVVPGVYHIALAADVTTLAAEQNSMITATVTDGAGNPASSQAVTFTLLIDNSTATITAVGATTDANGKAVVIYTAGSASPTTSVQDTVRASVTGSASAIVITRTASTYTPPIGNQITLTADVTSLAAGRNSVITATVKDGSGNVVSGQAVTFTLLINNSTATLATVSATTDTSGKAVVIYTAGANNPTETVQDVVEASVTGATGVVIITRTASTATPPAGYRLTITATPVSLAANANSVIIAKVINNATGSDAAGVTVTFAMPINNSTATLKNLSGSATAPVTGITDAQGYAIATYTAGINTPSLSIQDVVTATVTGSAAAAIITRLPNIGTGIRIKTFIQDPEWVWPDPYVAGPSSVIMKVTVTTDDLETPVKSETVTFSMILGSGTITAGGGASTSVLLMPLPVVTDDNGEAYVIFTRPGVGPNETIIRAQILGTTNGGDAARIVFW